MDAIAEKGEFGAAAGDSEGEIEAGCGEAQGGFDEDVLPFDGGEAAHAEEAGGTGFPLGRGGRKGIRDAEVALFDFGPMGRGGMHHHLAAGKVADGDAEEGAGDFVGQGSALGVEELVGAVDGHGEGDGEDATKQEGDHGGVVAVDVGIAGLGEPMAEDDGFGEIVDAAKESGGSEVAEAEGPEEGGKIGSGAGEEGSGVSGEDLAERGLFDPTSLGGFLALFGGEFFEGPVRRGDTVAAYFPAGGGQLAQLPQHEGVVDRGVLTDEVSDAPPHVLS